MESKQEASAERNQKCVALGSSTAIVSRNPLCSSDLNLNMGEFGEGPKENDFNCTGMVGCSAVKIIINDMHSYVFHDGGCKKSIKNAEEIFQAVSKLIQTQKVSSIQVIIAYNKNFEYIEPKTGIHKRVLEMIKNECEGIEREKKDSEITKNYLQYLKDIKTNTRLIPCNTSEIHMAGDFEMIKERNTTQNTTQNSNSQRKENVEAFAKYANKAIKLKMDARETMMKIRDTFAQHFEVDSRWSAVILKFNSWDLDEQRYVNGRLKELVDNQECCIIA